MYYKSAFWTILSLLKWTVHSEMIETYYGSYRYQCSFYCLDQPTNSIWCSDTDMVKGSCFQRFEEDEYKALGRGKANQCSNMMDQYPAMKKFYCPLHNICDDSKNLQDDITIPRYDGSRRSVTIRNGFKQSDVCRYQIMFP